MGDSLARPSEASSLRELEVKASWLAQHENRHIVYERLGERAGVDLSPQEMWILFRMDETGPITRADLAARGRPRSRAAAPLVPPAARPLAGGGGGGRSRGRRLHRHRGGPRRAGPAGTGAIELLTELLAEWEPEAHPEILLMVERLTRSLAEEAPSEVGEPVGVA